MIEWILMGFKHLLVQIHSMNNYYACTPIHQALNINLQWTVRQPLASYRKAFLPTLGHEEIIIRILPAQLVPWFIHWAYDLLSNRNSQQVFSRYPMAFCELSSNFTGVYDTSRGAPKIAIAFSWWT